MAIMHIDANSAYLSWTAVKILEEGYENDIREIPAAVAGDPKNRHGIILAKSIPAKKTMKSQIIIYTRALPRSSLSTMAMIGSAYRPESSTPRNFLMSSL